jgi:type I restriction enzyme S subunit
MIPEGWREYRLEQLGKSEPYAIVDGPFGSNLKTSDYVSVGIPVLQGKNITNNAFKWDDIRYISDDKSGELIRSAAKEGDLLIIKIGSIGYCAILDNLHGYEFAIIPANLIKATFDENKALTKFIFYYLTSDDARRSLIAKSSGNAQPALNLKTVKNISICLPPLPEQKRIAEVLVSVDSTIEATKAVITQTKKVKQGLLQTLLTQGIGHKKFKDSPLGKIPETWVVKELGDLLEEIKGGGTPSKKNPEYWNGKIPWASVKDLTSENFDKTEDYITELGLKESASNLIPSGTIIIATRMAVGRAIKFNCDVSINQDLKALFPKAELNKDFLFCWLFANREKIEKLASGSTVMGIRLESLRGMWFALPPLSEQKAIADIFEGVDSELNTETAKLASLQQLKKGLMHDLLTGKVRVEEKRPALQLVKNTAKIKKLSDDFCLIAPVEPLYKHALLRAEVACGIGECDSIKLEKTVDIATRHNRLDDVVDRTGFREAAGPYDGPSRHKIDGIFQKEKWFSIQNQGNKVIYKPSDNCGFHKDDYKTYLGDYDPGIQYVINLLLSETTEYCEKIATLYASWNDFLIDGKNPTDDEIIKDVRGWHQRKEKFKRTELVQALNWMRSKNLVPKGQGRKTKVLAA